MAKRKQRTIQIYEGRWYVLEKSYYHECCGCGLTHTVDTKLDGRHLFQRWKVNAHQTRKARKSAKQR